MVMRIQRKSPHVKAARRKRALRGCVALTLAACLAGAGSVEAASNRFAEFPTSASFAPGRTRDAGDAPSASFNERFYGLKMSVASITPIDLIPIVPQAPLTTASLPAPREGGKPAHRNAEEPAGPRRKSSRRARPSSASHRPTIRAIRKTWTPAARNSPPANATIPTAGPPRSRPNCATNSAASALARTTSRSTRWCRPMTNRSSSRSTMSGRCAAAASSISMCGRCAISIRRWNWG